MRRGARSEVPVASSASPKVEPLRVLAAMLVGVSMTVAPRGGEAGERSSDTGQACVEAANRGQVLRDEGKLLDARTVLGSCVNDSCPAVIRTDCAMWLAEVNAMLPSVVLGAQDATGHDRRDVRVYVDRSSEQKPLDGLPFALDPGSHTFRFEFGPGVATTETIELRAGERARRVIARPSPKSSTAGSPSGAPTSNGSNSMARDIPTGGWVLGGLGVVALGVCSYFGVSAKLDIDRLRGTCAPHCQAEQTQAIRRELQYADISLGAGLLSLAGAVLWVALGSPSAGKSRAGDPRARRAGMPTPTALEIQF